MDTTTLCLGALQLGDASGYEIKKMFEDGLLSHLHAASFGSIYPALTRLERDGLATATSMAQEKRPAKKVYSITDKGRTALAAALMAPPAPERHRSDFLFILAFGHLVPPGHLARVIEQRIAWYREAIRHLESCDLSGQPPGARLVNGLGLAVCRSAAEYLEQNRHVAETHAAAPPALVAE